MLVPSLAAAAAAALVAPAAAQNVPTYVNPAVPTGIPVVGNYTGPLRPQVHFSPPQNFMNDPNGMFVDANGTWHLYYQYNPTGVAAGNQVSWAGFLSHALAPSFPPASVVVGGRQANGKPSTGATRRAATCTTGRTRRSRCTRPRSGSTSSRAAPWST